MLKQQKNNKQPKLKYFKYFGFFVKVVLLFFRPQRTCPRLSCLSVSYYSCSFFALLFFSPFALFSQNTSNKGKEFWLGYGNHVSITSQKMVLYITSDVNTTGKVEIPGLNYSATFTVTANSIQTVTIPQTAFLKDDGFYDKGIHVTAEKAIVMYAHIYDERVSGASLILPVTSLGKEYLSINYKQISNQEDSYSYFFVVATEDNTEVEITPSAETKAGWKAGERHIVKLNKGQIYQVLGKETESVPIVGPGKFNYLGTDLTGSQIRSISTSAAPCKKIAVFSGSGKIGIGCGPTGVGSSDNLFQQVYPTATWGKTFITAPLSGRNYDVIRIVKSSPSAQVKLNGTILKAADFQNGLYYDFNSQAANLIEADMPVQVVQYAVSMAKRIDCVDFDEGSGDPEMIYLNPVEQSISDITVYSASEYRIQRHFINVIIKTSAVKSFTLDGQEQEMYFATLPAKPEYSFAQIPVASAGVHRLLAAEGFNAIAYGFGNAESYGYSAGTNLVGTEIHVEDKLGKKRVTTGCAGADLRFRIDLVYKVTKLIWDFKNGKPQFELNNPQPDSSYQKNGKLFYVYRLGQDVVFNDSKDYQIEVTALKLFADGCGNSETIPFDFSVYSSPQTNFATDIVCNGDSTTFTDLSDGLGRDLKSWHWDFGDGESLDRKEAKHIYKNAGVYTATLTVSNETSCKAVSRSKEVKVLSPPQAGFDFTKACFSQATVFTDKSIPNDGVIKRWEWNFGDSTSLSVSSAAPISHTYTKPGDFLVKLRLLTDKGCSDSTVKSVKVFPLPKANFISPEVCLADAYALFRDSSFIEGEAEANLSYQWSFGDHLATSSNPNVSIEKDPKHKYSATGDYSVTLLVTAENGCTDIIEKTITVSGSNPAAGFEVNDPGRLCSINPVAFKNTSSVDIGKITKIEWIFDVDGQPSLIEVDENPYPGKIYYHQYSVFSSPLSKEVWVKQVVYSGEVCSDVRMKKIVLIAVPEIDFSAPAEICYESAPVQLYANEHAFAGSGVFSGPGLSGNGVFKPAVAGSGKHALTYSFTTAQGCEVSVSKEIIVLPELKVNAGEDRTILAFGQAQLNATSNLPVLSYKWEPALGLSRDDIPNPIATPLIDTYYTITVTNDKGCTVSDKVRIEVLGTPKIPNIFTPNGDNTNDTWNIKYLESLPNCVITVFNRYGQQVFSSKGYLTPWDGKKDGVELPYGTYFYILNPGNNKKPISGNVTIIR